MASSIVKKLTHDDYGVAIICPLEVEMSAVRYMLDEEHARLTKEGDSNRYICGRMGKHNVVIGYLPQGSQGVGAAAVVATDMKRSFAKATLRLLVGIGGGVPSERDDIRLGDVVVSMPTGVHGGVVQYNLGKDTINGFQRKGYLEPPPTAWRTCVVEMQSDHRTKNNQITTFVDEMIKKHPSLNTYGRPAAEKDVLFLPTNKHIPNETTCQNCDHSQKVNRPRRANGSPTIFYGLIASGDWVEKNAERRDQIARDEGGALCFEMEAAGLMNDFRCIVIRGISDYADSHKNDDWHAYGAAAAAGCAKELLTYMDPVAGTHRLGQNQHWTINRPTNPHFTGRAELVAEIANLAQKALHDDLGGEQCRLVITGMGGQGKSEICLHVANQVRSSFWGVFWVDVGTTISAESGFLDIGRRLNLPTPTIDDVRQSLANTKQPWLLILDNADDSHIDYQDYFPTGTAGVIIITSRNAECHQYATQTPKSLEGLPSSDASALLRKAAKISPAQDDGHQRHLESVAVSLLNGHPLALIQAGAYIARGHCSVTEYPQVFERQRKRLLTFRPQQVKARYGDVYTTFEASAAILQASAAEEEAARDALQLLPILSMLAPSQLPLSLFKTVWEGAQDILRDANGDMDDDDGNIKRLTKWHTSHLLPLLDVAGEVWDDFRLVEAARLLEAYSLIIITDTGGGMSVSMHPLVHAWAKDRQNSQQQQQSWLSTVCMIAVSEREHSFWLDRQQILGPHLPPLLMMEPSTMSNSLQQLMVVRALLRCGWLLHSLRIDKELFVLLQHLFGWLGLNSKIVNEKWLVLYKLVGQNLKNYGQVREAVALLEQVVKIEEQTLAEDNSSRLASQHALAVAYQLNGQVSQAVTLLEQVVKIRELTQVEDHPSRLASQQVLAGAYEANGQVKEAVALLEQVVRIQERTQAEDHPSRLASQHALAVAYQANGQVPQAVTLLEQVVKIRELTQAEDHPSRLASQQVLAKAYRSNQQVEKAVALLEQVVRIQEQTLTEDHPSRLISRQALAAMLWEMGQCTVAHQMMQGVVEFMRRKLGDLHHERIKAEEYLTMMDKKASDAASESHEKNTPPFTPRASSHEKVDDARLSRSKAGATTSHDGVSAGVTSFVGQINSLPTGTLRGKLTVRIVEARGLKPACNPYCVCIFERNECIFHAPQQDRIDVDGDEKPTRPSSSSAPTRRINSSTGQPMAILTRSRQRSTNSMDDSRDLETVTDFRWDHEKTFDVTGQTTELDISVYDNRPGWNQDIFLGYVRTSIDMKEQNQVTERWIPLAPRAPGDMSVTGEILVKMRFSKADKQHVGPTDFQVLKLCGKGTFGQAYQVRKKDTERIYAMKVVPKKVIAQKKKTANQGDRDIFIRTVTADSPFIVGLKFSFQTPSDIYLVTDFVFGGELFWYLQKEGRFNEDRGKFYTAEIVLALKHLHQHDIVYRNLKPEIILLDNNGHIALCDFGLSKVNLTKNDSNNTFGCTEYDAPEILLDEQGYTKMVDFWSLGVLVFEMCCGWSPFYAEDTQQMYKNIAFSKIKFPRDALSKEGRTFVKGLLNRNPKHRLGATGGADELMEHPFFADIDWAALGQKNVMPPFKPKLMPAIDSSEEFTNELDESYSLNARAALAAGTMFATMPLTMLDTFKGFTFVDNSAVEHQFAFREDYESDFLAPFVEDKDQEHDINESEREDNR